MTPNERAMHEDTIQWHYYNLERVMTHLDRVWWLENPLAPKLQEARAHLVAMLEHVDVLLEADGVTP